MRKIKPTTKILAVAMAASLALVTIWVLNNQVSARAMPVCPSGCSAIFSFGAVGITADQTARLNVVNTKKCAHPPCAPAQVELRFVNSSGSPFTNVDGGQPSQSMVTLASGQSAFLDLRGNFSCPGGCAAPARVQIRAEVPSCVGCGSANGSGFVIPTLEVFDNATGKTAFVMPDYPAISTRGGDGDE